MFNLKQSLIVLACLVVLVLEVRSQEPPQRPYSPLEFETSEGVEIPIVWYETMYDSLSTNRGFDGYNSLQSIEYRQGILIDGDAIYTVVNRVGAKTMGLHLQARDRYDGQLLWETIVDTSETVRPWVDLSFRVSDDVLDLIVAEKIDSDGPLDIFPFAFVGDSSHVFTAHFDIIDGKPLSVSRSADTLSFLAKQSYWKSGAFASAFKRVGDTIHYYEYNKLAGPLYVEYTALGLDGSALISSSRLGLSAAMNSFDVVPVDDVSNYTILYEGDKPYLALVDNRFRELRRSSLLPIVGFGAFLNIEVLGNGMVIVREVANSLNRYHVLSDDLDYQYTVDGVSAVFNKVFAYGGSTYLVANKELVIDPGLQLYEIGMDSLELLYTWSSLESRGAAPIHVRVDEDYLYMQLVEGAGQINRPELSDNNAKAVSTLVLDLSRLDRLTSTDEALVTDEVAELKVYPCPAAVGREVIVESPRNGSVRIVDAQGRMVYDSSQALAQHAISTAGWQAGIYSVYTADGARTARLLLVE